MPHQREALMRGANAEAFAYLMDPGTGKTFVAINNTAHLFLQDQVSGMLVVAPNGVHTMWVKDQIPEHMPDVVHYNAMYWESDRAGAKWYQRKCEQFLQSDAPLNILTVNVDALRSPKTYKFVQRFVRSRRCIGIVDESSDIKSVSSGRGRRVRALRKWLPYRRIMDATPMEVPFDLYGQYQFLHPAIIGCRTFKDMKETYADWEETPLRAVITDATGEPLRDADGNTRHRTYMKLKTYKDLDKLGQRIAPYSFRCEKPPLPPKLFVKHYYTLAPEAQRLYDELVREQQTILPGGHEVSHPMKMVRMLRAQQISCGYVPAKAITWSEGDPFGEPMYVIPGRNARLEALLEVMARYPGPTIIWCKFNFDEDLIFRALQQRGYKVGVYQQYEDGEKFQNGVWDILIAKVRAGGRGHTWTRARYVITYSQEFSWTKVLQSQDRVHRIGLEHPVLYIDLIADHTDDERIVQVRVFKEDLTKVVTRQLAA